FSRKAPRFHGPCPAALHPCIIANPVYAIDAFPSMPRMRAGKKKRPAPVGWSGPKVRARRTRREGISALGPDLSASSEAKVVGFEDCLVDAAFLPGQIVVRLLLVAQLRRDIAIRIEIKVELDAVDA